MFTKQPIDCLTDNSVEMVKVSLIGQSLDNRRYGSNHQNYDPGDLPCDGDENLIARRQIYCVDDGIILRLINGSSVYV